MNFAQFQMDDPDTIEVPADASPMDFLRAVYLDPKQSLPTRLKAAIAAAGYAHPKLAVTAVVQEGGSIADRLEAARKRSARILEARFQEEVERRLALRLAPPMIEAKAAPEPQAGPTLTRIGAPMSMPRMRR
jgi:hypothetical protein